MDIMNILLNPDINHQRIARKRPLVVKKNSSFVIDITNLAHYDDVKKDMYGKWNHSGSHLDVFKCSYEQDKVIIDKAAPGAKGDNVYYLRRLHSVHPSNSEFRRLIAYIFGKYSLYCIRLLY